MTDRRDALALAFALALSATLSACSTGPANVAGPVGVSPTVPSVEQTAAPSEGTSTLVPNGGGSGGSTSEVKTLDQQLDAMQKELDSLKMPSDSDFGDAESALY